MPATSIHSNTLLRWARGKDGRLEKLTVIPAGRLRRWIRSPSDLVRELQPLPLYPHQEWACRRNELLREGQLAGYLLSQPAHPFTGRRLRKTLFEIEPPAPKPREREQETSSTVEIGSKQRSLLCKKVFKFVTSTECMRVLNSLCIPPGLENRLFDIGRQSLTVLGIVLTQSAVNPFNRLKDPGPFQEYARRLLEDYQEETKIQTSKGSKLLGVS